MANPLVLFGPGSAPTQAADGKRFVKELLRTGEYQHPTNPWPSPLKVDEAKIDELVRNTSLGYQNGVKVPFPITHNDGENPEANRGFWDRVFKAPNPDGSLSIFGEVDVTNPDTAAQLGKDLRDVSVYISDFGSGTWKPEGDRIVHACITNYPVFAGQQNFVALSVKPSVESNSQIEPLRLTRNSMKITPAHRDAAKAMGVTLAGDDLDEVALSAILAAGKPKMIETPALTEADVPKILSVDPKADRYFSAYRSQVETSVKGEVETAEKAGRLTKDMAEACRTLLSVTHAYALGTDGKAVAVDAASLVRKVLSAIPENAIVPLVPSGADLGNSAGKAPANAPDKFDAKVLEATAQRMSASLPRKAAK